MLAFNSRRSLLVESGPKRVALPVLPATAATALPVALVRRPAELSAVRAPDVVERMLGRDVESAAAVTCGVCLELLVEPVQCRNGHVFCATCGRRCASDSRLCPLCRCEMSLDTLCPAVSSAEALARATVRCRFAFDANQALDSVHGCQRLLALSELAAHEVTCPAGWLQCVFATCKVPLRPSQLDAHVAQCEARPVVCSLCHETVCVRDVSVHVRDTCRAAPSGCSLCSWTGTRADFVGKHVNECDNMFVPCDVCGASVRRSELQAHNQSALALHVDTLSNRCHELSRANELLRQRLSTLGPLPTKHRFSIGAHVDTFVETQRTSPPLLVEGLAFAVRLELTREQQCAVSLCSPTNLVGSVTVEVAMTFTTASGTRSFASRRQALQFTGTRSVIGFVAVSREWLVQQCGFPLVIVIDVWLMQRETNMIAM